MIVRDDKDVKLWNLLRSARCGWANNGNGNQESAQGSLARDQANDKLTRESCRADELTWRATVREDWVRENSKTSSRPLLGGELDKEGSVSVHNRQSVSRERDAGDQMKERTPAKLP